MAGNLVKSVMLKIVTSDGDSQARLDAITAKADELGRLHPDIKVRIDTAAASAKVSVLRAELKAASSDAGDGPGLRGRLMALGSTAGVISGVGDAFGAFNAEASMGARIMSGFSLATGLLEGPMAGLIVGVGGLASGLAAAGAGLGVFGAVAKSVFTTASTAATAYAAAQQRLALATTAAQRTSALAAEKAALYGLTGAQKQLAMQIAGAHKEWQGFVAAATPGVSKVIAGGLRLIPQVLADIKPLLAPVEGALSGLVSKLGKGLGSAGFMNFISMMAANTGPAITKLGTAIGHIAVGFGGILRAFMPFSQIILSGLDSITAKFAHWGQTLSSHSGFQSLVSMARADMPYVITIVKNLGGAIVHLGGAMTGLSTFSNSKMLLQMAAPLSQLVNALSQANPALLRLGLYALAAGSAFGKLKAVFGEGGAIGNLVSGVKGGVAAFGNLRSGMASTEAAAAAETGIWGTLGGGIMTAVTAVKSWTIWSKIAAVATRVWTGVQAAFDVVMDANPIALVVIAVAALIAGVILAYNHFKIFREIVQVAFKPLIAAGEAVVSFFKTHWRQMLSILTAPFTLAISFIRGHWQQITAIVGDVISWVRSHWPLLLSIMTGPIGAAVIFIVQHWHQILSGAQSMITAVVGWFRRLPGMILSAVGNLGRLLWQGGVNIVMGLVHGIESVAMAPVHALGSIVSGIRNLLPFSPAKTGPLSGSGSPDLAGRKIPLMLAAGIDAGSGAAAAAANRMAGAVAGGVHGARAGTTAAAGGQQLVLEIQPGGHGGLDALFITWLQNAIRAKGGSPDIIIRKVKFA
jgi:hypothetical protein